MISAVMMLAGENNLSRVTRTDGDQRNDIRHEMVSAVLMRNGPGACESILRRRSSCGLKFDLDLNAEEHPEEPGGWMVSAVLMTAGQAGFENGVKSLDHDKIEELRADLVSAILEGRPDARGLSGDDLERIFADKEAIVKPLGDLVRNVLMAAGDAEGRFLDQNTLDENVDAIVSAVLMIDGPAALGSHLKGLELEEKLAEKSGDFMVSAVLMLAAEHGLESAVQNIDRSKLNSVRDSIASAILEGRAGARGIDGLDLESKFHDGMMPRASDQHRQSLAASLSGGVNGQGLNASDLESKFADGPTRGFKMPAAPKRNLLASLFGGSKTQGINGSDLESRFADGTARGFTMPAAPQRDLMASVS
eukprot:1212981-Rhodomonas_salina.1